MLKTYLKAYDGHYLNNIIYLATKIVFLTYFIPLQVLAQQTCQSLFLPAYTEIVNIDMPGSVSPAIHRLNLEDHLKKIRIQGLQVHLPTKTLKKREIFWIEPMSTFLRVKNVLPGNQVIFESYKGSEFQFSFRHQVDGIFLRGLTASIANPNVQSLLDVEASLKVPPDFYMHVSSIPKRIRSQIEGSRSFKNNTSQILIQKKVQGIYERVFDKIKKNESLAIRDIQDFNRKISRVTIDSDHAIFAGVMRGTIYEEVQGSTLIRVDLKSWQMGEEGLFYLSAREVPKQLQILLERINSIHKGSNLNEILRLYEQFIMIHPFIDGNGRTGRVLLDYMLIKAGFRVMSFREITIDEIFKTNQQIYNEAIEALRNLQP